MAGFASTALSGAASALLTSSQANAQASARTAASNAGFAAQARQTQLAQQISERQRREALRRAQAQRRARFGGSGTGSAGGSAAAVLSGLRGASAREGRDQGLQRREALRGSLVDLQNRNRLALLEARQARERAFVGAGTSVLSSGITNHESIASALASQLSTKKSG